MSFVTSLRAQRSNPKIAASGFALLAMTFLVTACKAETPQASHELCKFTFMVFEENMTKASEIEGVEKLYHTQMAHMNIDVMLAKGCCKYSDTCPAAIME